MIKIKGKKFKDTYKFISKEIRVIVLKKFVTRKLKTPNSRKIENTV
jgi:hypothetical protein